MRDATRGGCAAVFNEIADASDVTIVVRQGDIPVPAEVRGACDFLGLDPLHVANEGDSWQSFPPGGGRGGCGVRLHDPRTGACVIGAVEARGRVGVLLKTEIGSTRVVDVPSGELLPRIC